MNLGTLNPENCECGEIFLLFFLCMKCSFPMNPPRWIPPDESPRWIPPDEFPRWIPPDESSRMNPTRWIPPMNPAGFIGNEQFIHKKSDNGGKTQMRICKRWVNCMEIYNIFLSTFSDSLAKVTGTNNPKFFSQTTNPVLSRIRILWL